ncbi:transposase [Sphingobacterium detergens]|uniref:transposase n=1 Tax=Sphingobacterium detergens TaxID=1145106 RepID=UPI003CC6704E
MFYGVSDIKEEDVIIPLIINNKGKGSGVHGVKTLETSTTISMHHKEILNYFDNRSTNASAESFNAKIKAFRTQFRGVGDINFFLSRLTRLFA